MKFRSSVLPLLLVLACHAADSASPADSASAAATGPVDSASILAASDLPATLAAPLPGDPAGVTIHRLSNGMSVYISTVRDEPRFDAWIAVRTGGRNDPANSTGLAHYLEHMLFKGSDEYGTLDMEAEQPHVDRIAALYDELRKADEGRRAEIFKEIDAETVAISKTAVPNELSKTYSAIGVQGLNAFTNNDATVYIGSVPANRIASWARVESERFRDPVFRLFFPELEAVYEEKNRGLDSPGRRVYNLVSQTLYPDHPYGSQTVLGSVEHLKTPAYGDMVAYFERWYVPNNMAIILAGDVDAKTALPILEKYFSGAESKPVPEKPPGTITPIKGRKFASLKAKGEETVQIAWPTVPVGHPDEDALVVMDWLVDNSSSGLLNVKLLLSQKLPSGGSNPQIQPEAGHWNMRGTAKTDQSLKEVEDLLLSVRDAIVAGEFTQEQIDAIVLNEEISLKQRMESTGGRVSLMQDAFIERQPWAHVV
ncbi:MAG: insulinase family protein, partial [Deltaproteobacteria bacterium]|nr:insulinase family protein [Deltaproteobacteria bacterium]